MTPDLSLLSTAVNIGFWVCVGLTIAAAAVCAIVAWINRPRWVRRIEEGLRRHFRSAI